jgi:hypothetical protein
MLKSLLMRRNIQQVLSPARWQQIEKVDIFGAEFICGRFSSLIW